MSRKQEFINFLDELMEKNPDIVATMSDNVKAYIEILRDGSDEDKPTFTDTGKLIIQCLQENLDVPLWKAKDIGEKLFVSSRTVSGAMRKLVTDGFVEKVSQEPVVYAITEKGKNVSVNVEENE